MTGQDCAVVEPFATAAALCRRLRYEATYELRIEIVRDQKEWLGFLTDDSRFRLRRLSEARRQYVRRTVPLWRRMARLIGMDEDCLAGLPPRTAWWIDEMESYIEEHEEAARLPGVRCAHMVIDAHRKACNDVVCVSFFRRLRQQWRREARVARRRS